MSYITKNSQGPVTIWYIKYYNYKSYITKNSQGPVTLRAYENVTEQSYITKNSQGPVTLILFLKKVYRHTLLKIHRVL